MHSVATTQMSRFVIVAIIFLLWGCGGSGSGSGPDTLPAIDAPQTIPGAKVTVLLTDAPSDEFDEINVTISSITLLGGDGPVVLFEGIETIDLLMLENFADLFAITNDVPAGSYNKIRLQIDDLQLVQKDDGGNITETIYPDLPANGKLDLNPQASIDLAPGDDVVLQLDIDAKRSIHIVGTGNGRYKFRPVVFVELLDDDFDGKAVRINGEVVAIDDSAGTFDLCQQSPSSADSDSDSDSDSDGDSDSDSDSDNDSDSDVDDEGECLTVNTNSETGFFDSNAESAAFSDLMLGDSVLAIGRFINGDVSMFEATVVAIDTDNVFARYEGVIQSAPDANNTFDLLLDPGQGFVADTVIGVVVEPGTGIADDDGNPLDASFIEPGVVAEIDGLLMLSNAEPDVLKAIYVALKLNDDYIDDEEVSISGQILSIDEATESLVLATGEGDRCVVLDEDAKIFLITVINDVSTTDAISLTDVALDAMADIYGEESVDGCLVAGTILING